MPRRYAQHVEPRALRGARHARVGGDDGAAVHHAGGAFGVTLPDARDLHAVGQRAQQGPVRDALIVQEHGPHQAAAEPRVERVRFPERRARAQDGEAAAGEIVIRVRRSRAHHCCPAGVEKRQIGVAGEPGVHARRIGQPKRLHAAREQRRLKRPAVSLPQSEQPHLTLRKVGRFYVLNAHFNASLMASRTLRTLISFSPGGAWTSPRTCAGMMQRRKPSLAVSDSR